MYRFLVQKRGKINKTCGQRQKTKTLPVKLWTLFLLSIYSFCTTYPCCHIFSSFFWLMVWVWISESQKKYSVVWNKLPWWKMSQITPNLLGKKYLWRKWELAGVKLIFFNPLLQVIHVLIVIVPLKSRQKVSENVVFLHSSHFRLEQTFAHLFGEPIMPGVICRHWGVFTSGKRADIGVKGSRSDTAKSSSSSEHK